MAVERVDLIIVLTIAAKRAYDLFILIYPGEYINRKTINK
jgi:hypothetical protein